MTIAQELALRIAAKIIRALIMMYQFTDEFTIAGVDDPEPAKLGLLDYSQEDYSQTYLTPERWDRSLSIPDAQVHTPVKRGDIIRARWSPILLIITKYEVIGHVPESQVGPDLTPDWQEVDRDTAHRSYHVMLITSVILSFAFLFGFAVGALSYWYPVVSLAFAVVFGYGWRKSKKIN